MSDEPASGRRTLKQRLAAQFNEYGKVAVYTYLALSLCAIVGFSIAIGVGAQPSSATGFIGVIAAGWVAAKATLPLRVLITLGLTPIAAYVVRRRWPKRDEDDDTDAADDAAADAPQVDTTGDAAAKPAPPP